MVQASLQRSAATSASCRSLCRPTVCARALLLRPARSLRPARAQLRRCWKSDSASLQSGRIISATHKLLINSQRESLVSLHGQLRELDAASDDLDLLTSTVAHLDELFLLCIVGEFNAGKSSLINALLGGRHLEDGVTPTTDRVYLIKHAAATGSDAGTKRRAHLQSEISGAVAAVGRPPPTTIELPVPWLEDVTLVDTPGTNAIIQGHAEITEAIVPRCDLLLFVTSVDRPISESERIFMSKIKDWGKKVVVVVNKADLLMTSNGAAPGDLDQVLRFVRAAAADALAMPADKVQVFAVSARGALLAKEASQRGEAGFISPEASAGFSEMEAFILKTLSGPERLKMKLDTPVQVASVLVEKYLNVLAARLALVNGDAGVVARIESDLVTYKQDMTRDFGLQKAQVENILLQMAGRGDAFFEQELSLSNLPSLLQAGALRSSFEQRVVANITADLDQRVRDLVDWMVGKTQRQAGAVLDFMHAHKRAETKLVGVVGRTFESNRSQLVDTLQKDAQAVVLAYDRKQQTKKFTQRVQMAVGMELGMVSLGGVVAASLMDVTGLAAFSIMSVLGLAILPTAKQTLKAQWRDSVTHLSDELNEALSNHLEAELERSVVMIRDSFAPFDRYVRSEQSNIAARSGKLTATLQHLRSSLEDAE